MNLLMPKNTFDITKIGVAYDKNRNPSVVIPEFNKNR